MAGEIKRTVVSEWRYRSVGRAVWGPDAVRDLQAVFGDLAPHDPAGVRRAYHATLQSLSAAKYYSTIIPVLRRPPTRKSDTLFIMGSGPSINEIDATGWSHIRKHDSWGFNFSVIHEHVPDAYILQSSRSAAADRLMQELFEARRRAYSAVPLLIRGDTLNRKRFHESCIGEYLIRQKKTFSLSCLPELYFESSMKVPPALQVEILDRYGFLGSQGYRLPSPKFGSTVGLLVPLALMSGFSNIVLCGIDMKDNRHFYDAPEYAKMNPSITPLLKPPHMVSGAHPHMVAVSRTYPLRDYLMAFGEHGAGVGVQLCVGTKDSALYPSLPYYAIPKATAAEV